MQFTETGIKGVFVIEMERREDERGWFARSFCRDEYRLHGLNPHISQCNFSFNHKKGTLRGMHYQIAPHAEAKTVRCTRGSLYDVALDLRPDSSTYLQWFGIELSQHSTQMIYIPVGIAHGFLTLEDETEVFYEISESYYPELSRGVRWDDPAFGIQWPLSVSTISVKDGSYPFIDVSKG